MLTSYGFALSLHTRIKVKSLLPWRKTFQFSLFDGEWVGVRRRKGSSRTFRVSWARLSSELCVGVGATEREEENFAFFCRLPWSEYVQRMENGKVVFFAPTRNWWKIKMHPSKTTKTLVLHSSSFFNLHIPPSHVKSSFPPSFLSSIFNATNITEKSPFPSMRKAEARKVYVVVIKRIIFSFPSAQTLSHHKFSEKLTN